jgi:acetyltransferase-like isoleucine patch superfamily enzyme
MSALTSNAPSSANFREVAASFGARKVQQDPAWEKDFSSYLRDGFSQESLRGLLNDHSTGESAFDCLMRRVLMRAICRRVGSDLQLGPGVVLKHPETMEFGDSVFVGAQSMIQGRFDGSCVIGNHVWIGPQAYFDARQLVLEDYVGWGPGARVLGSTHTGAPIEEPIIKTALTIKPVSVGFGADIGMNASILPGVRIGEHSIVGAGAVVTHDVPPYAIVAGVPAKVIRDRREG